MILLHDFKYLLDRIRTRRDMLPADVRKK
jgi:hypothetical protein